MVFSLSNMFHRWVARWYILRPKISLWVNLRGFAMVDVGLFYGRLVYFMVI
jgi:hypothetical protein